MTVLQAPVYTEALESASEVMAWLKGHGEFHHFIDGEFQTPSGGQDRIEIINPATCEVLATVPKGTKQDIDAAVEAARRAFASWSTLSGFERAKVLYAIARAIRNNERIFAVLESINNGKPIREARIDIALVVRHFEHHAGRAQTLRTDFPGMEPIGVVGQVIPWNFPLLMFAWKVAVAIATGNTVVIKTSETTPLSALLLAQIMASSEVGLPKGVINIVNGDGSTGDCLVRHPDVDKIAFTGSTEVGRKIRIATAGSGKKLTMELGGKSPFIVCEGADLNSAVEGVIDAIFFNKGEVCCAGSRLIVQESIAEEFLELLRQRMSRLRVGNPLDKGVDIGALNSKIQFDKVIGLIEVGRTEGCTIWQPDGCMLPSAQNGGFFVAPTLVTDVSPSHTLAQVEIFGPVLVVHTFREVAEAVALANNTPYGLAACVWSQDLDVAFDIASQLEAGTVWINCTNQFDGAVEFGGRKESGWGSEGGDRGMLAYLREVPIVHANHSPRLESDQDGLRVVTPHRTRRHLIGGTLARPDEDKCWSVFDQGGNFFGSVGRVSRKDLRNAVEAARKALPGWRGKTGHNRAQILRFLSENLADHKLDIGNRLSVLTGLSLRQAEEEIDLGVQMLCWWAAYADRYAGTVSRVPGPMLATTLYEPLGVIGIRCSEDPALLSAVSLMAAAIAQGNTVVMLSGKINPVSVLDLIPLVQSSDVPAGVVNILSPQDPDASAIMLARDYEEVMGFWDFGMIASTGKAIEEASAHNLKRTWTQNGQPFNWFGGERNSPRFLLEATSPKAIWVPYGA